MTSFASLAMPLGTTGPYNLTGVKFEENRMKALSGFAGYGGLFDTRVPQHASL